MNISKNFIRIFLLIFVAILVVNILTPIFKVWNIFYGIALLIMVLLTGMLFTRKSNAIVFHSITAVLILVLVIAATIPIYSYFHNRQITYSLDVGSSKDMNSSYLYPTDRISNVNINQSSRELLAQLVYFNVPSRNFAYANVTLIVLDNFPANSTMILSLKKDSKWNYINSVIFNQTAQNNTYGNWTTLTSTFNLDKIEVQNKTLTFLINTPHLGDSKTKRNYIAIDSINVTYFN